MPARGAVLRHHPGVVDDAERWYREHPKVSVILPDQPQGDWRAEEGYGWIAKIWFRTWADSRAAVSFIRDEGWEPRFWGRKVRVGIKDGFDGQRLAETVLERWPDLRKIQLRCD